MGAVTAAQRERRRVERSPHAAKQAREAAWRVWFRCAPMGAQVAHDAAQAVAPELGHSAFVRTGTPAPRKNRRCWSHDYAPPRGWPWGIGSVGHGCWHGGPALGAPVSAWFPAGGATYSWLPRIWVGRLVETSWSVNERQWHYPVHEASDRQESITRLGEMLLPHLLPPRAFESWEQTVDALAHGNAVLRHSQHPTQETT